MSLIETLDENISIRLTAKDKEAFKAKCAECEITPQEMARMMIGAFLNDTLRISVSKNQRKTIRGIHV